MNDSYKSFESMNYIKLNFYLKNLVIFISNQYNLYVNFSSPNGANRLTATFHVWVWIKLKIENGWNRFKEPFELNEKVMLHRMKFNDTSAVVYIKSWSLE